MSLKASHLVSLSLLVISLLWLSETNATVLYKKVDKDGNVTYTDKPSDDAEVITLKTGSSQIANPPISSNSREQPYDVQNDNNMDSYQLFAINSPVNGEKVGSDDGSVSIVIEISPQIDPNHSIRLHMDGVSVGQDQKIPYFNLTRVDNGTYELVAIVIDDETQEIVQTSRAVTFHLVPTSALNR